MIVYFLFPFTQHNGKGLQKQELSLENKFV